MSLCSSRLQAAGDLLSHRHLPGTIRPMDLAGLLKILSDKNRLRILALLDDRMPCVCDLEAGLEISQSNLSRHLNKLRSAGLVQASKKGMFVYYRRAMPGDPAVNAVLEGIYAALRTDPLFLPDRLRLEAFLKSKPADLCG